jgi:hypothetical protein
MRRHYIIIFFFGFIVSCSQDNSIKEDFTIELLPITEINLPNTFIFDESYTLEYSFIKPTDCHLFHDLYYNIEDNERTLAVFSKKLNNDYCQILDNETVTRSLNFHCSKESGIYIFKIWQGENNDGEDEYLIYEIPIIE